MELWIPLTIGAAFFQNLRSALQKSLTGKLSTFGSAYVRFLFGLPVALVFFLVLVMLGDRPLPQLNWVFFVYALLGGVCQILFTVLLLWLFSFHNFAVGTTLSKLETVMVAVFGLVLLGDKLNPTLIGAIAMSTIGLVLLTAGQTRLTVHGLLRGLWRLPTAIGLLCAASLGLSVVLFRGASLALNLDSFLLAAATTLLVVLVLQSIIMGVVIGWREPGQLGRVMQQWKPAIWVGLSGGLASIGWFSAFTLENATHVRALGQIELVFTFIVTLFFFREKISLAEISGILLIVASILIILIAR